MEDKMTCRHPHLIDRKTEALEDVSRYDQGCPNGYRSAHTGTFTLLYLTPTSPCRSGVEVGMPPQPLCLPHETLGEGLGRQVPHIISEPGSCSPSPLTFSNTIFQVSCSPAGLCSQLLFWAGFPGSRKFSPAKPGLSLADTAEGGRATIKGRHGVRSASHQPPLVEVILQMRKLRVWELEQLAQSPLLKGTDLGLNPTQPG